MIRLLTTIFFVQCVSVHCWNLNREIPVDDAVLEDIRFAARQTIAARQHLRASLEEERARRANAARRMNRIRCLAAGIFVFILLFLRMFHYSL